MRSRPAARVAVTAVLAFTLLAIGRPLSAGLARKPIVAYFTAWGIKERAYFVKHMDTSGAAKKLTHINYAFGNVSQDLKCEIGDPKTDYQQAFAASDSVDGKADPEAGTGLRGNFGQLLKLKAKYPDLKILISIGGWGWSERFSDAASSGERRETFVRSCVEMFVKGNIAPGVSAPGLFDGIDIDWEFPGSCGESCDFRPEDTSNFSALMAEFRHQLDDLGATNGKRYLVTIATSAREREIANLEVKRLAEVVDFVNVMTYDFHISTNTNSNFNAPLHESEADPYREEKWWVSWAVDAYLNRGLPPEKLFLGIPFYGHGWEGVAPGPAGNGLYQPVTGPAQGKLEKGYEDYRYLLPLSAPRHYDSVTQSAWTYDLKKKIFWSYDDPESLRAKMDYARTKDLGGVMLWEISGDDESGSLLTALREGIDGAR
jgi:chitinase